MTPSSTHYSNERCHKTIFSNAFNSGLAGAGAMSINVLSLMWMRTTVNYQYRYGTSTMEAMRHLYKQGGIPRFYRGLLPALAQGPLSRFGDTAANEGVLKLWDSNDTTRNLPVAFKTIVASGTAASFRILLMPIDSLKTIMQVEGQSGITTLVSKIRTGGPGVLWHGAIGASTATFVGHYPWFLTYNSLNEFLPTYDRTIELPMYLSRSALMGFTASAVSDTVSNSIRVVKTGKQASTIPTTYPKVVRDVVTKDGIHGLLFRGLTTKIISNGLQGLTFSVLWKLGEDYLSKPTSSTKS